MDFTSARSETSSERQKRESTYHQSGESQIDHTRPRRRRKFEQKCHLLVAVARVGAIRPMVLIANCRLDTIIRGLLVSRSVTISVAIAIVVEWRSLVVQWRKKPLKHGHFSERREKPRPPCPPYFRASKRNTITQAIPLSTGACCCIVRKPWRRYPMPNKLRWPLAPSFHHFYPFVVPVGLFMK